MKRLCGVHHNQLVLLLAAAVVTARALDPSHNLANERTSIERTYELTKYLEYQLKEIKDTYLSYLGPPFNEKDFSPPRPNSTALSLPSAATRLELWRGLENRARLAQNQRAYSVLLAAVRELARSTLCPYLQTSLLHFCTGLDGLLGSISGLMTTLGYALPPPPPSANMESNSGELQYPRRETGGDSRPAPLMSQSLYEAGAGTRRTEAGAGTRRTESGLRDDRRRSGTRVVRGEAEDGVGRGTTEKKRGREGRRAEAAGAGGRSGASRAGKGRGERGRRGRREEPESWKWAAEEEEEEEEGRIREEEEEEEEELEAEGGTERWGRRLLSIVEDGEEEERERRGPAQPEPTVSVLSHPGQQPDIQTNNNNNNNNDDDDDDDNQYSYSVEYRAQSRDTPREEDGMIGERGRGYLVEERYKATLSSSSSSSTSSSSSSSSVHQQRRRPPRSLFSPPTLHPPLSTLSLLYPFGAGEEHTLLPQPVPLSLRRGPALLPPPLLSSSSSSSSPLLSVRPALNDFSRKVEGFWILRELQSWLWRSAKDFNRLKKRLRG